MKMILNDVPDDPTDQCHPLCIDRVDQRPSWCKKVEKCKTKHAHDPHVGHTGRLVAPTDGELVSLWEHAWCNGRGEELALISPDNYSGVEVEVRGEYTFVVSAPHHDWGWKVYLDIGSTDEDDEFIVTGGPNGAEYDVVESSLCQFIADAQAALIVLRKMKQVREE